MTFIFKVEHVYATVGVTQVNLRAVDDSGMVATLRITDREEAKRFEPGGKFTVEITPAPGVPAESVV